MSPANKHGITSVTFVVILMLLMTKFVIVSFTIHMRRQTALLQSLDSELAASLPCQQTVKTWLTTRRCLPPLGEYYHAALLPDAICAWVVDPNWNWGLRRCATP